MSNTRIRILTILFFSFSALTSVAQQEKTDSLVVTFDNSSVPLRHFDESRIEELKDSAELNYGGGPAALSLWERFIRWLLSFLEGFAETVVDARWFEIVITVVSIALLVYVILRLLRIDALKMFYGKTSVPVRAVGIEENIHEMDFEKLLADAVRENNYRLAIRLLFLQSLKILSDKHLIQWQPGKTNHDYLDELDTARSKPGFQELNHYFEYAWYGNFKIAPDLFNKVKSVFNNWKNTV